MGVVQAVGFITWTGVGWRAGSDWTGFGWCVGGRSGCLTIEVHYLNTQVRILKSIFLWRDWWLPCRRTCRRRRPRIVDALRRCRSEAKRNAFIARIIDPGPCIRLPRHTRRVELHLCVHLDRLYGLIHALHGAAQYSCVNQDLAPRFLLVRSAFYEGLRKRRLRFEPKCFRSHIVTKFDFSGGFVI